MKETDTLLDVFLSVARNSSTIEDPVLQCGSEQWTYGDLDSISTGLALDLHEKYGLRPTIVVVSENHPYVLAILLATWKLGGIFAPFDCHAPLEMVEKMLENTEATCTVVPDSEEGLNALLERMKVPKISYSKYTTITSLTQHYLDQVAEMSPSMFPSPSPYSLAAYLHTSSATSANNLKCVQLTHNSIANGCRSVIKWFHRTWPSVDFDKLKVLGIGPWSHLMALTYDFGAATFGTGGCLILGVPPSGYSIDVEDGHAADSVSDKAKEERDVLDRLLDVMVKTRPDALGAVPWVLEGFKTRYTKLVEMNKEVEALRVKNALQHLKCFSSSGAAMSQEMLVWVQEMKINASNNIGMTELGGGLFFRKINLSGDSDEGWSLEDCLLEDAKFVMLDENGNENLEGELVIASRYISQGYLKYDNSAFHLSPDGTVTFKTGDLYTRTAGGRFVWKGRKDDYIQTVSGEKLDPRPVEKILNACPAIAHCCVVGNNFMYKASDVICVLVQPVISGDGDNITLSRKQIAQITSALAAVNRTLLPPLRISWPRLVILEKGMEIPYTTKGMIFRKKLEMLFGSILARRLKNGIKSVSMDDMGSQQGWKQPQSVRSDAHIRSPWKKGEVESLILDTIAPILGIGRESLCASSDATFAEFGMDSNMAIRIVNELNSVFAIQLPLNACHTFINIERMSEAILDELGLRNGRPTPDPPKPQTTSPSLKQEVVIIGQALRLPGNINTPEAFWEALINKRSDIMIPIPADRWDHASFYRKSTSTDRPQPSDINFEKAGFVDVAHFDNTFFGISAPEAFFISPSVRLIMETAFEALENANIPMTKVKGTNMGAFVAAGLNEAYTHLLFESLGWNSSGRYFGTGTAASTASGRLSYLLDIHGPSITTDTACSSGLVVLDQAVKYIQSGDGESAIVAAASTNLWPGSFGFLSANKMASPSSRCATFTDNADGYVPSEGCVAFIVKSKSAAIRDNDNIAAVVRSTEVMHGGKSQGLVSPNVFTQVALQKSLLRKAGLQPSDIDFLETHGTGTLLGDLIEIQGINEVFENSHSKRPLVLGATKSCIGHTEMASGLVGLLGAMASFKHAAVPGLLHLNENNLNPSIDCNAVPLHIPYQVTLLPKEVDIPYRGLVLSNGFAGTIAGAIVEDPRNVSAGPIPMPQQDPATLSDLNPRLFAISAKTPEGLVRYLHKYLDFCRTVPASHFADLCYTSCTGREHYRYRFACTAHDLQDLINQLERQIRESDLDKFSRTSARVVFAFPGQGSQFQGMASELADCYPDFRSIVTSVSERASKISGYPVSSFLLDKDTSCKISIDEGPIAQICIFVYQYSLALWLKFLGIEPSAVLGHSFGEVAASVIAGAMGLDFGLSFVVKRAEVLCPNSGQLAGMAIVAASEASISQHIHQLGFDDQLVIAVYNAPESHVVSGEMSAIDTLLLRTKAYGLRCTKLNVAQGYHSPSIYPYLPALETWLKNSRLNFSPLNILFFSTVYGSSFPPDTRLPEAYWVEHARNPVQFARAIESLVAHEDINILLDIGPQPLIWATLQEVQHHKALIATSTKKSQAQNAAFLRAIALLFEHGMTLNFERLLNGSYMQAPKMEIPTYPFTRQRFYPNHIPSRRGAPAAPGKLSTNSIARTVQFFVDQGLFDLLSDHLIESRRVVPGACLADFFASHAPSQTIQSLAFHSPLVLDALNVDITGEIDENGRFSLFDDSSKTNIVCSGILAEKRPFVIPPLVKDQASEHVRTTAEVYDKLKHVKFGPTFRNVQEIRTWATHADALINVQSSGSLSLDRIRKLDACLHAFGAVISQEVPQIRELDGSFLPSALENFALHNEILPESFLCRYYLPPDVARNYHIISVAFDALSTSGELLISCQKYSVAWIPTGVAIQKRPVISEPGLPNEQRIRQAWVRRDIDLHKSATSQSKGYNHLLLVILGDQRFRIGSVLSAMAGQVFSLHLGTGSFEDSSTETSTTSLEAQFEDVIQKLPGRETPIVIDLTGANALPMTEAFRSCHRLVLRLMQLFLHHKVDIQNCLIISEMALPIDVGDAGSAFPIHLKPPTVASLVQGMVRVFRRETGFDSRIKTLDMPELDMLDDGVLQGLIITELSAHQKGLTLDRAVAYRRRVNGDIERFVPVLQAEQRIGNDGVSRYDGTSLIVGLGSIGTALAQPLVYKGSSSVVFVGRRSPEDAEVRNAIQCLEPDVSSRVAYVQADVCDAEALRQAISDIQTTHGAIRTIAHSAAVISDAAIQNVEHDTFESVINPKVVGAWNLHNITEELCPSLLHFVLLSSISVSLGKQGQVAYVAGNYYMEALAAYRRGKNLPATALQLGPWESRLTQNLRNPDAFVPIMDNERGLPLILECMSRPDAVQMIANLDLDRLAAHPVHSQDPLFQALISLGSNKPSSRRECSEDEISSLVAGILRTVLELRPSEKLELGDSLTGCGVDSISYAQIRGRVMHELQVELPLVFLSDTFTIREVVAFVVEKYQSSAA